MRTPAVPGALLASCTAAFDLPVYEVDERYSTTEALAGRRRADADAAAACVILEQFLRSLP